MNHNTSKFAINANTATLLDGDNILIANDKNYIVPIYQRPYSWSENELQPFISDIFNGYKNNEPLFIGTIQLSSTNDIIDGQQRLTTLTILLRLLDLKFSDCGKLNSLDYSWITTKVNSGEQQEWLAEFINVSDLDLYNTESNNKYIQNGAIICRLIKNYIDDEEYNFDINNFLEYISSSLYVVVIETCAGLAKTLQIFNTINTSGLDLNGSDIFKIRIYEYLKDVKGRDENVFEDISNLYQLVDQLNVSNGNNITFGKILWMYQSFLISKYNLSSSLYTYGTDTFFERFFNTLLNIKEESSEFKSILRPEINFELKLLDIERIIRMRFQWDNSLYVSAEHMFAHRLIGWSRYGRYTSVVYHILLNQNEPNYEKVAELTILLNKMFFVYSIYFYKAINNIHSTMYDIFKMLYKEDGFGQAKIRIIAKINEIKASELQKSLLGHITDNAKKKNLICLMSEYLSRPDDINIDDLKRILFKTPFDIEHIHANADDSTDVDKILQNSIGNLAMLEYSKNRSLGKKEFAIKREVYKGSDFFTIKEIANNQEWNQSNIETRLEKQKNIITQYIYGI